MGFRNVLLGIGVLVGGLVIAAPPAGAQSIEDRLRSQLRSTTEQLHELQDGQAQLQAQLTSAQQDRDKAQADLKQAQAALAEAKGQSGAAAQAEHALTAERASHAKDSAELAKTRSDFESLLAQSRTSEAAARESTAQLKVRDAALQTCEAKNARLYDLGHQILDAYEHVGLGTFFKSREPFAQATRVKYDQIAQDFGDKLYDDKFNPDARQAAAPAAAASQSSAAQ
jgi:DNA repair exonuclease SbcCD ATPase subunit